MFVSVPTRTRTSLRWATPLLAAALWAAFVWAISRSDDSQRALMLEWGALAGGPANADPWQPWMDGGHWLRLLSALFLHADWAHLLGNLVFLLIFGLPAERVMGPWRLLGLFLMGGALANLAAAFAIDRRGVELRRHLGRTSRRQRLRPLADDGPRPCDRQRQQPRR